MLREGDVSTTELLREQFLQQGEEWLDDLRSFAEMDDHRVSQLAKSVIEEFSQKQAESDFDLFCRFFPENGDLEEACWMLAAVLLPDEDIQSCRKRINHWGSALLLRIAGSTSCRERVEVLAGFLSKDLGFQGNSEDYYNPENSLLPTVFENRTGLPIALCCIAIFLSHRAGMNVVGINMPGHFIVRHGEVLFDPFHGCRILTKEDCGEILRCQGIEPGPACFQQASPRRILQRILSNLVYAFDRKEDAGKAALTRRWMHALRREA